MAESTHELLKDYSVVIELPVTWGEMDAFNHVNNTVYFRYFESARIAYFERLGLMDYMRENNKGPILGSTQCRFKVPLTYPDKVFVGARVRQLQSDRFVHQYIVVSEQLNRVAAEGEGQIVYYDYSAACKTALPAAIYRKILEQDPAAEDA